MEAAAQLAHVIALREGPPPGSVLADPTSTSAVGESPNGSVAAVDTLAAAAAAAAPAVSEATAASSDTTAAVSGATADAAGADVTTATANGEPAAAAVTAVSVAGGEDGEIVDLTAIKPKPAPPAIVPSDVVMLGFSDSSSSSKPSATGASAADAAAAAVGVESLTLQRHNGRGLGLSKPPLRLNEHGEPEVCLCTYIIIYIIYVTYI
jgi:hypothetical protein